MLILDKSRNLILPAIFLLGAACVQNQSEDMEKNGQYQVTEKKGVNLDNKIQTPINQPSENKIIEAMVFDELSQDVLVPRGPFIGSAGGTKKASTGNDDCDDSDRDTICDIDDNCPTIANYEQIDNDNDSMGKVCDCDDNNSDVGQLYGTVRYVHPNGDNTDNDCGTENNPCQTIQYAHDQANINDTVILAEGIFKESDIILQKSINIYGQGPNFSIIDAMRNGRVINIDEEELEIKLCGFKITNGLFDGQGAGIISTGNVLLSSITICENEIISEGDPDGAGISNRGTITIVNSTVNNNINSAGSGSAGGMQNIGIATIINSTFSDNIADSRGGAITNISNSILTIKNSTLGNNTDRAGGSNGISNFGILNINNTIISNQAAGTDCSGPGMFNSNGYNLEGGTSCGFISVGDKQNANADLQPLADNGGPTQTQALGPMSDAIDMGNISCGVPADQRGFPRSVNSQCDIGAFEVQ